MARTPSAAFLGLGGGAMTRLRGGLLLAVLALCVACSTVYRNHGYVPDTVELQSLVMGKDTRETVTQKVGRPSSQGILNEQGWFYVQSRFEYFGPKEPVEVNREVVVMNFAANGTLSNIGRYGLENGRVIELSRRVTESNIKGVTFVGQLLGNVGRIQAQDYLAN